MADLDEDEALLAELGQGLAPVAATARTPQEERLIAGFEEILRFVDEHGRAPQHGEEREIFERAFAVRLDRLRALTEAHPLLTPLDTHGLLLEAPTLVSPGQGEAVDDDALLADLGVEDGEGDGDITQLRHVRSFEERKAAEDIANRTECPDFDRFQPLFERVEEDIKTSLRKTLRFGRDASVDKGNFFILGGQMAYVAEVGESFRAPNGESDARLRVIYSNGTESNLLQRSLQRALYKDETGRRITDDDHGPLFGDTLEPNDIVNGTIYVLRSLSDNSHVVEHRELIHKIGITGGKVETRISNAEKDPTYMLAKVEVVATYKLSNLNRARLENLFHRIFQGVRLDLTIEDRFGNPVKPREWFLVPLQVIDEAVKRIQDGSITNYEYDAAQARLVLRV
ncbi:GIY-YIG nuclease family protein [Xanthomonas campestris]|uniref:GIY-YIG nuclease family protein n=1 Tax=Xanthomonas campestris TaxID=339 RepID=UPI00236579DB|nr:GIY-YIG nuclease family protein [Xanthomonas campestris]MEA0763471.1 GIY-YIG nuclease family protein [Xanthomonas campestris pv. campestris]MEB1225195.1 GIY-YIG nuclease family protein [Xanthomonas campestris pv. campestris]MEB1245885.1 GIY-YIG nuclease family protein [Xanthomonas campestris pv. campestris]MEB1254179.1 GIY-YIG nuclease family protein [Xanthomonas campestris pv. campestris]MEB1295478.1 GIY-YIG nuclease family protein [Xanthomonas campestris pv. campestris]